MWKKRIICLMLLLCAVTLTACQARETFPTEIQMPAAPAQSGAAVTAEPQGSTAQDLFSGTSAGNYDFDNGSYDPSSEEDPNQEPVENLPGPAVTAAPIMQSEYAGATPVLIDPIDKPTPTPLPTLTFSYETYEASALHLTFDAPSGWLPDGSQSDTYTLTNPNPGMDYAAWLSIRVVPVNKAYNRNDLTREIKGMLDTIRSEGFTSFSPSNTANRTFLGEDGIYANYSGTMTDGVKVAGRVIASCVNKTLYIFRVSYPQGYTDTYVDGVFKKVRDTIKLK